MDEKTNKETNPKYIWAVLAAVALVAGLVFVFQKNQKEKPIAPAGTKPAGIDREKVTEIKKFLSEQDFKDYITKSRSESGYYSGGRGAGGPGLMEMSAKSDNAIGGPISAAPARVSETNVQVAGIDEPDAVKTDGKEIFFSVPRPEIMPLDDTVGRPDEAQGLMPLRETGGTKTIKAYPPDDLAVDYKINKSGDLLLAGNILIVIPSQRYYWAKDANKIFGFDVSDPKNPKELWNIEMKEAVSIAGARLYKGKIYLATKTDIIDENKFCAMEPLIVQGRPFKIKCNEIYHPTAIVPADATYTAMIVNPATGAIEKDISFVGSSDYTSSVVYMSENSLYVTYYYPGDQVKILNLFFSENKNLVPDWFSEKLQKLEGYDISSSAKQTEIWNLVERYQSSFSSDDRMKMENEIGNKMTDFFARHRRELDSTGIVKISADNLNVDTIGTVPGKLLNQFSLDEYKGDLRAATTVGQNFFGWGFSPARANETANDVYILGDNMKIEGSVIDLGKGEQIYSVRFIEDKGYVVTFKQVDPFFVLDLSDPMNPEKKGELKIPGYSSYLHPITKDKILGIGEENNKVKVSLFDVSDPADPTEIAKYNLDEYWSEVSQTHHAFLLDQKHEIFFLPGSKGGYIFSYAGDSLSLVKTVSETAVKRAVYINDYLYVIGENSLVVLDERNWERVGELDI
ncbi:MAG: beta-propeller domain-containing protein [Candidatus Moranbacteria bacterium]|nr:beta-propeller domain-containing protein [Candidatus Moranbacteria bacterium]